MKRLIFIFFLTILTQSCATRQEKLENLHYHGEHLKKNSLALNVALATGLTKYNEKTLSYSPIRDVENNLNSDGSAISGKFKGSNRLNLDSTYFASDAATKLSGISMSSPGLGLISLGLSIMSYGKNRNHPALFNALLVWMPGHEAANARESFYKLKKLLLKAYSRVLPAQYKLTDHKSGNEFIKNIKGGRCQELNLVCEINFNYKTRPFITDKTPAWLDSYHEHTYHYYYGEPFMITRLDKDNINYGDDLTNIEDTEEIILGMSKHLPDWVFFYRAPKKDRPFPLIYNKGNILKFISPK